MDRTVIETEWLRTGLSGTSDVHRDLEAQWQKMICNKARKLVCLFKLSFFSKFNSVQVDNTSRSVLWELLVKQRIVAWKLFFWICWTVSFIFFCVRNSLLALKMVGMSSKPCNLLYFQHITQCNDSMWFEDLMTMSWLLKWTVIHFIHFTIKFRPCVSFQAGQKAMRYFNFLSSYSTC